MKESVLTVLLIAVVSMNGCSSASSNCAWDEIYNENECQVALDREYEVTINGADVPTDGSYDAFGGAPDLLVLVGNEEEGCFTPTKSDTFSASWMSMNRCEVTVLSGGDMYIVLVDEDVSEHDELVEWHWEGSDDMMDFILPLDEEQVITKSGMYVYYTVSPAF
jgi:hypothetical protein